MKAWSTLIRREFWECRSLWIAPVCAAGFLIAGSIVLAVRMGHFQVGPGMFPGNANLGGSRYGMTPHEISVFIFSSLILGVGMMAMLGYTADCLYAERKDRSILFWKSLPVSDARTVLAKAAIPLLVMPIALTLLAILTHLAASAILSIPVSPMRLMWQASLIRAYGHLLLALAVNMLWFAPLFIYVMLASVLSSRTPLVTALVPIIILAAGEKILFNTFNVGAWVGRRLNPVIDIPRAMTSPQLWIGLLLGAAVLLLIIRLRRWRDDS